MIRRGEPWGRPAGDAPELVVEGSDRELARAGADPTTGVVVWHPTPGSDLARSLGWSADHRAPPRDLLLPLDLLRVVGVGPAVNAVVLGCPPRRLRWHHRPFGVEITVDGRPSSRCRATTVIVASGQFVEGDDLVPRGHPGDGRVEVQTYAVPPSQRAELRRRLHIGAHLPHPGITQRVARERVVIEASRPVRCFVDGHRGARRRTVEVSVEPSAFLLRS